MAQGEAKEDRLTADGTLTPRQERFVEEYLIDLNATQAAIRAGYSPDAATEQGYRLLTYAHVQRAVATLKEARTKAAEITQENVLRELHALTFSNVTHYQQNPQTGILELAPGAPANAMSAVASVKYKTQSIGGADGAPVVLHREVEFKLWDKPGSIKLAGRYAAIKGFAAREADPKDVDRLVEKKISSMLAEARAEVEREERAGVIDVEPTSSNGGESGR